MSNITGVPADFRGAATGVYPNTPTTTATGGGITTGTGGDITLDIESLSTDNVIDGTSDFIAVADPVTGETNKTTLQNAISSTFDDLGTLGSIDAANDEVVIRDDTDGVYKRVPASVIASGSVGFAANGGVGGTAAAIELDFANLPTETNVDSTNDLVAFVDASTGQERKTAVGNLLNATSIAAGAGISISSVPAGIVAGTNFDGFPTLGSLLGTDRFAVIEDATTTDSKITASSVKTFIDASVVTVTTGTISWNADTAPTGVTNPIVTQGYTHFKLAWPSGPSFALVILDASSARSTAWSNTTKTMTASGGTNPFPDNPLGAFSEMTGFWLQDTNGADPSATGSIYAYKGRVSSSAFTLYAIDVQFDATANDGFQLQPALLMYRIA